MSVTMDQAASLLAVAAAFDQRTIGRADATAWQSALAEFQFEHCRDAIVTHYRDHRERITVADLRGQIKAAQRRAEDHARRGHQLDQRDRLADTRRQLTAFAGTDDSGVIAHPGLANVHETAMTERCRDCDAPAGERCVNDGAAGRPWTKIPHAHRLRDAELGPPDPVALGRRRGRSFAAAAIADAMASGRRARQEHADWVAERHARDAEERERTDTRPTAVDDVPLPPEPDDEEIR